MKNWIKTAASLHKPMPVLSYPGKQLTGITVEELVRSGQKQAECMKAIADKFNALASVALMDLSVEAEAFGSPVRFSENEPPTVTGAIIKNESDAERLTVPQIGEKRTGEYVKTISLAKKLITDRPVFAGSIGPFSLAGRLMDMTEIMVQCYEEPGFVHSVLEKASEFLIKYNSALRDAGADGIVMAEPAAGLLSPPFLAEFSSAYVKRIISEVETDNCIFVYHNCGKSTYKAIDAILDTGAKFLHFGNAIDMAQMLTAIPSDILAAGNIDPAGQFMNGTPESIREATINLLNKCADYPNFVLSSGCDIPPNTPMANIDAFFTAAKEFYEGRTNG